MYDTMNEHLGATTEPEWLDEPRTLREAFPARDNPCRDPRVNYDAIEDAIQRAWVAYPHASNVVGLWTPTSSNDVCVEVWTSGRRARVIPADRIGEIAVPS